MPIQSEFQRAFLGGEIAPALGARADQAKYLTGLRRCRNFIVQRHGGVRNRPGTRFIAEIKDSTAHARLIPFIFEAADQTYLIEAGHNYFRFYWHGAVVEDPMSPGDAYEVTTTYAAADVPLLQWTQSADTLVLTHPSYPPRELKRVAHDNWTITTITTAPSLAAPASLTASAGTAGTRTLRYKVAAVKTDTLEESYASSEYALTCTAPTVDAPNALSWTAVSGAQEYNVYLDPYNNGIFGFIGIAHTNAFKDVGFTPDFTVTPATTRTLFATTSNYPSVATYYQQRLFFGRSIAEPEKVWGSQVGAFHNFSVSTPLQDDDAIEFVIASAHLNPVRHLVPLKKLLVLSDEGEWVINGDADGTVLPTAIAAAQEGFAGANAARPATVGNTLIYAQARGTAVRQLRYAFEQGGFATQDLSIFATHLFQGYTIVDLGYAQQPDSIVWAVRSDGTLLGLTYVPEQDIWGWHRHDTGASGVVEAICVLPDATAQEDALYLLVKRHIDGGDVRYIERLASWTATLEDAFFVDAGLTYDASPATTFSNLDHLEGEIVAVVADGVVIFDGDPDSDAAATYTVTGGVITLAAAASVVHIGLPIRYAELETLDLDAQGTSLRDKKKRVQGLAATVETSAHGFLAGPDSDHLLAERPEPWDSDDDLVTGPVDVNLTCAWEDTGRVFLRVTQPLPFALLGIIPQVEVGG